MKTPLLQLTFSLQVKSDVFQNPCGSSVYGKQALSIWRIVEKLLPVSDSIILLYPVVLLNWTGIEQAEHYERYRGRFNDSTNKLITLFQLHQGTSHGC